MKLREWLKRQKTFRPGLQKKEILIECPNGLLVQPVIKLKRKNPYGDFSDENIESLVITWEH